MFNLKRSIYGIPSNPTKIVEIHAHDFLRPHVFQQGANGVKNDERRVRLLEGVMNACATESALASMTVFAVIMHKPDYEPYYPAKLLQKQHVALLERINRFMELEYPGRMATLIFDEGDLRGDLIQSFKFGQFLFTSSLGQTFWNILDTPLFVASRSCPGIQIADVFAGAIRMYKEKELHKSHSLNVFETAVVRYYEIAKSRTKDLANHDGNILLGFHEMAADDFPRPPTVPAFR